MEMMTSEFFEALKWSASAFVCGICLREYASESIGKWLGRSGMLIALFVMTAFGMHSVKLNAETQQQARVKHTDQIATPGSVVAVSEKYQTKSESGFEVSVTKYSDGRVRTMLPVRGRDSINVVPDGDSGKQLRESGGVTDGADRRFNSLSATKF